MVDARIDSLRIASIQAIGDEDYCNGAAAKKFECVNEVTTQKVQTRYFRKAAAGAKYVGSPPCLQAITCNGLNMEGCRLEHFLISKI